MSLIEQALRRIKEPIMAQFQSTEAKTPGKPEKPVVHSWPTSSPSQSSAGAPPQTTLRLIVVAAAVFGLTAVLVIGGIFWVGRSRSQGTAAIQASPAGVALAPAGTSGQLDPAARRRIRSTAEVRNVSGAPFLLNGIVEGGGGKTYAMINGEVVSVGDQIKDATLTRIADGKATLRHSNGTETVLGIVR